MIALVFIALAFILEATQPTIAPAQSFAGCQAWLCLPAGYDTRGGEPTNACDAARQAVLSRLRRHLAPLPSWSSCASRFGWDAATLTWSFPTQLSCPNGGTLVGDSCQGIDGDGCSFTYTARNHGNVWVHVNGQRLDARYGSVSMPYTLAVAGARQVDRSTCRDPDEDDGGTDPGDPPQVVGPPVGGGSVGGVGGGVGAAPCNTISCPHVHHGWGADVDVDLLHIHWTLQAAPPAPQQ